MASEKKESVTFISKFRKLKLIIESAFTKEVNGKFLPQPGKYIQFVDGMYETSDKDEIKFLESHKNFETHFIKVDKEVASERAEYVQTLEQRNAELEARLLEKDDSGKKVVKEKTTKTKKKEDKAEF